VEQNYGIYEGMDRKTPGFLENKRHFAVRYPGGESMMDVAHRIYGLLEDVKRDHAGKNVLLVCHGGVLRLVRSYFEPMTNEEYFHYSPGNADIREYEL
jgi:probable phosphoglycerate mutase